MYKCPVCSENTLDQPAYKDIDNFTWEQIEALTPPYEDTLGKASYDVCPACGFEYGNDDNPGTAKPESFAEYRSHWRKDNMNDTQRAWEKHWESLNQKAEEQRESQVATVWLCQEYKALDEAQKESINQLLPQWILSDNIYRQFDALALVQAFKIASAIPSMEQLAQKLQQSSSPGALLTIEKINRIIKVINDDLIKINCPVCDYALEFWPVRDEICPGCGIQFGYDDGTNDLDLQLAIYSEWRKAWRMNDERKLSKDQITALHKHVNQNT